MCVSVCGGRARVIIFTHRASIPGMAFVTRFRNEKCKLKRKMLQFLGVSCHIYSHEW